jgi:hypothetical protein
MYFKIVSQIEFSNILINNNNPINMRKILIAALVVASFSAKAQMSIEKVAYIGKTSIEGLKIAPKWQYNRSKDKLQETLFTADTSKVVCVNWKEMLVFWTGKKPVRIESYEVNIIKNATTVKCEYGEVEIKYNEYREFISAKVEEL